MPLCSIDGCDKPARRSRAGWCEKHYMRWYRHGDPMTVLPRARKGCQLDGCDRPHGGHGWCKVHLERVRKHGDPRVVTTRGKFGDEPDLVVERPSEGYVTAQGYRLVSDPWHPLANASGGVLEHRKVLYAEIGPGAHPCHWCATKVSWDRTWPQHPDALVVDHLDHNRLNNDPDNLVPSCFWCNRDRVAAEAGKEI